MRIKTLRIFLLGGQILKSNMKNIFKNFFSSPEIKKKSFRKVLFIFGTRPEAIKLAPLIKEFQKHPDEFATFVLVTAQHREMLDQVTNFFKIEPDYDLNLMKNDQTLFDITSSVLIALEKVIKENDPDLVVVQGDTTTAFMGALAAFYLKKEVVHIEAGLRTNNIYSPFPEEINRVLISSLANYHFAPTKQAVANLKKQGIVKNVWNVGNTGIDALYMGIDILEKNRSSVLSNFGSTNVMITVHRRENLGAPLSNVCEAVLRLSKRFPKVAFIWPVHPNPKVKEIVEFVFADVKNVVLLPPLAYYDLIALMKRSSFIITDSGGLQEEAPALHRPVLVARCETERPEGIKAGVARLVGTDTDEIVKQATRLLTDGKFYNKMAKSKNPYGDGTACRKILDVLRNI